MKQDENIFYGEDFYAIGDKEYVGYAVHVLCLNGSAHFIFNDMEIHITKNDLVIYSNAELISQLQGSDDLRVEFIALRSDWINTALPSFHYGIAGRVSLFSNPVIRLDYEEAYLLHETFQHLRRRITLTDSYFYQDLTRTLAVALVYELFSFHIKRDQADQGAYRPGIIVKGFLELIYSGSVRTHRNLKFYAERLNVTERYLADTIRRLTGQTATEIITNATKPIINEMLRNSDLSIAQISEALHFNSLSYFSTYVLKNFGMRPAAYRNKLLPVKI